MRVSKVFAITIMGAVLCVGTPDSPFEAVGARAMQGAAPDEPWKAAELIRPEELAGQLSNAKRAKPKILCVGFSRLFAQAHLPAAEYCGPASRPEGLEKLRQCARDLARPTEVVIYCGCCPWNECPNIRPAFRALREMGFTRLKVLEIPRNLGQDWVAKGFPVEKE